MGQKCSNTALDTVDGRIAHRELVDQIVSDWMRAADADVLASRLQEKGISAHVSWNMEDVAADAHLLERQALMPVSAPGMPDRLVVGSPARFSTSSDVGVRRLTPELGQDEEYVFGQLLGMSTAQRTELESREVIL
jgi:crotonobetainyl-CoA:carnitine CoA-transferase CaiB-like acyl-CoA transferase